LGPVLRTAQRGYILIIVENFLLDLQCNFILITKIKIKIELGFELASKKFRLKIVG
jgi:hypothetical protein